MQLVGIQFKCKKGHTWLSAGAQSWSEMPYCPRCYKADYKGVNHIEPAVAWQGEFDPPMPKPAKKTGYHGKLASLSDKQGLPIDNGILSTIKGSHEAKA